ncbi:curli-like amyloid fiber formation chaperone CsgH [Hymenobacter jejuensis]|uniref:Curli assembly protein CsgC n=1 Tax=Hymenobacter jejuensis TaxID=2502781 RepID=A0A5B7ZYE0_9BACT|nr:curli-like amyloid fiber formation chaperone CsgH [Hymenobacter jejuensis]QDA60221.1 hypothetical protein FHG12_08900 [Hymenobacter jejuensis]
MKHLLFSIIPFLAAFAQKAEGPASCKAQLETHLTGDNLTIVGHCQNQSAQTVTLRYELLTDKRGQSGTSHNTQSGAVAVASQQSAVLSQTTINVAPTDFYKVKLRLLDAQGTVVAEDSLVHHPVASRP